MADTQPGTAPEIVFLEFADSKVPEFKEVRSKDYILYGEDNLYPEYLDSLYNKSDRHGAIVNAKTKYISGSELQKKDNQPGKWAPVTVGEGEDQHVVPAAAVNRDGETMYQIIKKSVKDIEIYGGFRWAIVSNLLGQPLEIYHVEFKKLRRSKCKTGYWYKENWAKKYNTPDPVFYEDYSDKPGRKRTQIFAYNEYRPGCSWYPLPEYLPCCNYIEIDIEIGKFHLSAIVNGMAPSKMIQFYTGEPTEDKKKDIERRFRNKYTGAEKAGKFMLVFNTSKEKTVDVQDLSANDLDKQFELLDRKAEQHIITGHQIVSPMLFGIKQEGQLGGNNELRTAYEVFINTYAKPKQDDMEYIVNYFGALMGAGSDYSIKQLDPVGIVIPDALIEKALQPDEVRERVGLPVIQKAEESEIQKTLNVLSTISPLVANKILENLTKNEIRGLAALPPVDGGDIIPGDENTPAATPAASAAPSASPITTKDGQESEADKATPINDNLKNLTGKQNQQLMRIIRQYAKGTITKEVAIALLKSGFGLSDDDCNAMLGIDDSKDEDADTDDFAAQEPPAIDEDAMIKLFDSCGELKQDFHIVTSKALKFTSEQEVEQDEINFFTQCFAVKELTNTESKILELIKKDSKITPEVIAKAIKSTPEFVTSKIASLVKRGVLESSTVTVGEDTQIERTVTKKKVAVDSKAKQSTEIFIKYSYEVKPGVGDPIIPTSRPFCIKMIELDRLYSRAEIERISEKLGYSVWDRRGGWWGHNPTCRHRWVSHIVVKKQGK